MFGLLGSRNRDVRTPGLIRLLWILMVLVHAPPLWATWRLFVGDGGESLRLGSFIGLNLSTLFFALKIWDVQILRFQTDLRSLLAIAVALTLMHAPAIGVPLNAILVPEDVSLAASSVLLAAGLSQVQRVLRGMTWAVGARAKVGRHRGQLVHVTVGRPPCWLLSARLHPPRPPPALPGLR